MAEPGLFRYKCSALFCENKYYFPLAKDTGYTNKHFFKVSDKDINKRIQWFEMMQMPYSTKRTYFCEDHFSDISFVNSTRARLTKFANPTCHELSVKEQLLRTENDALQKTINIISNVILPKNIEILEPSSADTEASTSSTKRKLDFMATTSNKKAKRCSLLKIMNETRVNNLSPREKTIYSAAKNQRNLISTLKKKLKHSNTQQKATHTLIHSHAFFNLSNNITQTGINFIKSICRNAKTKRPTWTKHEKVFSLALHQRGPKLYRFLRLCLPLPSRSTINRILQTIPFEAGINELIFQKLSKRVSQMKELDRTCIVMFDEISLAQHLVFDQLHDKVVGYVDLGSLGRKNEVANHALVFMVHGLRKAWKQPVVYYFTKDVIKADALIFLLQEIITKLQQSGVIVLATVCDQGSTNRSALRQLSREHSTDPSAAYFFVNNQKVFTLYDVPHLLKSTRNAFFAYNIIFDERKIAKSEYVRKAFNIDKLARFQGLRKIREMYFDIKRQSSLKMKVCVAARIFSNTVAAFIETVIGDNSTNRLPAEAIYTAEFIHDMDTLFDSFNGRTPSAERGKPFRRCVSKRSRHHCLWDQMLEKISSWIFCSKADGTQKTKMPFKEGWLTTIKATKGLFDVCHSMGFQFLRTRSLNQDPLENTFATIRQCNAGNTNPTFYQFVSTLKSSVLNNLIYVPCKGQNCEKDESALLDNLNSFLDNDNRESETSPLITFDACDFNNIDIPSLDSVIRNFDNMDKQTTTYVAGFLIKKIKMYGCEFCKSNLFSNYVEPHHTFVMFKEYDDKQRLTYVTTEVIFLIAHIHDIVYSILLEFGHIEHISQKIKMFIISFVNFNWFTCYDHALDVKNDIVHITVQLIIKKYYDDLYRSVHNNSRCQKKKMDKFKHL